MLARAGWQLWQIQFMGRWSSMAVAGYVEEAWAERTATWTAAAAWTAGEAQLALPAPPAEDGAGKAGDDYKQAGLEELGEEAERAAPALAQGPSVHEVRTRAAAECPRWRFVVSRSGCYRMHVVPVKLRGADCLAAEKALCGFVAAKGVEVTDGGRWRRCGRCVALRQTQEDAPTEGA